MLQKVVSFPDQVADAYSLSTRQKELLPEFKRKFSSIVILGMGGSAIIGDFVRILLNKSSIPVHVCRNSSPPSFVNSDTLVIAISYSGKTHETLQALDSCLHSGAQRVVVTSSKELDSQCKQRGIPCLLTPWNNYSRASFGYLLLPVLGILSKVRLFNTIDNDISETISVLDQIREECGPNVPMTANSAHKIALALVDRLPVLYGENNFTDVIALRWKQQLNENSKARCYYDIIPEIFHNEIEVWDAATCQSCTLILLRDSIHEQENHFKVSIEAANYLIKNKGTKVIELWTRGKSELARLLSLSYLADFVSVYLASLKGVDPRLIGNIDYMKKMPIQMNTSEVK